MSRLIARATLFLILALLAGLIAAWQYSKFRHGHGIALIRPEHGDVFIFVVFVLMLGGALWAACTEKLD
jgi:hypothetical protein